tara:strand:- start:11405 stop:12388 length:984 start_codon:yes stop_codon:yes gene_type:complete
MKKLFGFGCSFPAGSEILLEELYPDRAELWSLKDKYMSESQIYKEHFGIDEEFLGPKTTEVMRKGKYKGYLSHLAYEFNMELFNYSEPGHGPEYSSRQAIELIYRDVIKKGDTILFGISAQTRMTYALPRVPYWRKILPTAPRNGAKFDMAYLDQWCMSDYNVVKRLIHNLSSLLNLCKAKGITIWFYGTVVSPGIFTETYYFEKLFEKEYGYNNIQKLPRSGDPKYGETMVTEVYDSLQDLKIMRDEICEHILSVNNKFNIFDYLKDYDPNAKLQWEVEGDDWESYYNNEDFSKYNNPFGHFSKLGNSAVYTTMAKLLEEKGYVRR